MPAYDVKDVHLYIESVMKLDERQRVNLWYSIVYGPLPQHPDVMLQRFDRHCDWTKANILFRFGPIIDKIVRKAAQHFAQVARVADGENV